MSSEDMTEHEAEKVIRDMLVITVRDVANLQRRVAELVLESKEDPWEGTVAQIERLRGRHTQRVREMKALMIAVANFEEKK